MKALPRWLVADLAFFDLGLKVPRRGRERELQRCELDALGLPVVGRVEDDVLVANLGGARESQPENKAIASRA